jgi:hypothetical protein
MISRRRAILVGHRRQSFQNKNFLPANVAAIKVPDGRVAVPVISHHYETKTTRLAGLVIANDAGFVYVSISREQCVQCAFISSWSEVSNINSFHEPPLGLLSHNFAAFTRRF